MSTFWYKVLFKKRKKRGKTYFKIEKNNYSDFFKNLWYDFFNVKEKLIVFEKKNKVLDRTCYIYWLRNNWTYKTIYLINVSWMYNSGFDKGLSVRDWCSSKKKICKLLLIRMWSMIFLFHCTFIFLFQNIVCLFIIIFNSKVHILLFT